MALIPVVGAVYAQLIVAAVFLLVILVTMFRLQRPAREKARAVPVGASPTRRRIVRRNSRKSP